jgi:porphobilinogen synthase
MSLTEASTPALQTLQIEADPANSGCQAKFTVPACGFADTARVAHRPRRLRRTETLRRMVRENILRVEDLIYPLFVMAGEGQREEVPSMPGCYRYTLDLLLDEVKQADEYG